MRASNEPDDRAVIAEDRLAGMLIGLAILSLIHI